jgi:hypothetical protein
MWGAAVVALGLLVFRVLPWGARAVAGWRTRIQEREETLVRTRRVIAALPRLKDSLADLLPQVVALAPEMTSQGTAADASADLTAAVRLTATRAGLRVVRTDPLPDSSAGALGVVAVHAQLEGDIAGLTRALRMMEIGAPTLTVRALSVDAPTPPARRDAAEALRLELTVAGWYLVRGHQ